MNKINSFAAFFMMVIIVMGCNAGPGAETATPAPTLTAAPPTSTPLPSPTATPEVFNPPADRFLPSAAEIGAGYEMEDNLLSENMAAQAQLPVPADARAAASFRNTGSARATDPQNGLYYRLTYWVVLADSEANARFLYGISQSADYSKNAFLVVMPGAIQEQMGAPETLAVEKGRCDDLAVSTYVSDTYAAFRQGGPLPTVDPLMQGQGLKGGASAEELAKLPPDLFFYAACRVKNAIILAWGHAPDNYDGKNAPIPDEVIAAQVAEKLDLVIEKLRPQ